MSRESNLELKVGAFVLIAMVGLSFFVASITDFSFMDKGRGMQAIFSFANGLRDAAPVRLAGVEAGQVKKMVIFNDASDHMRTKIRVFIWIKEGIQVPSDSTVTINQLGLLGEKYIEIVPGKSSNFLPENTVMIGLDPTPMEKITERVSHLTEKLEITIDNINNGLLSPENQLSIKDSLADLKYVMDHIKSGDGTVGKLLVDEGIYRNLEELTADLKLNPWKLLYRPKK